MGCVKEGCGIVGEHVHPDEPGRQEGLTLGARAPATQGLIIHVTEGPTDRLLEAVRRDPCRAGIHTWAWALLARGGERQVCARCGRERA